MVFIEEKGDDIYLSDLDIPVCIKTIKQLDKMSKDLCADGTLSKYS